MSVARQAVTRLTLDMSLDAVQKSVAISKGDTNRRMEITLTDAGRPFTLPSTWTATLSGGQMEDGCVVERGRILYDLSSGVLTAEAGIFELAFRIFDEEGDEVATPMITCNVYDVERNTEEVASTDEFSVLRDFIKNINDVGNRLDATDSLHNLISTSVIEIYGSNLSGSESIALPEYGVDNVDDYDYIALLVPMDRYTLEWAQRYELSVQNLDFDGGSVTAWIKAEIPASADDPENNELILTFMCIRILKEAGHKGDGWPMASFVGIAQFPDSLEKMVRIKYITIPVSEWQDSYPYSATVYPPSWGDLYDWYNDRRCVAAFIPMDKETLAESQRMELEVRATKSQAGVTWATIARNDHIPSIDLKYACMMTAVDDPTGSAPKEIATYIAGVTKIPDEVLEKKVNSVVGARLEEIVGRMKLLKATVSKTMWSDTDPWNADILLMADMVNPIVLVIPADEATREESQNLEVSVAQYNPNEFSLHIYLKRSSSVPTASPTIDLVYYLLLLNPTDLPDGFVPVAEFVGVVNLPDKLMSREVMRVVNANTDTIVEAVLAKIPNGEEMSF
jgi:hypothetical protein